MSQRSQVATSGSRPIAQCSAAWIAPGSWRGPTAAASKSLPGSVHHDRARTEGRPAAARGDARRRPRWSTRASGRNPTTWFVTCTSPNHSSASPSARRSADVDDRDVRDVACLRVEVGVGLGDHRHPIGRGRAPGPGTARPDAGRRARDAACRTRGARRTVPSSSPVPPARSDTRGPDPRGCRRRGAGVCVRCRATVPCRCVAQRAHRRSAARATSFGLRTEERAASSSGASGSSRAAQRRCGSSTYGFVGSITAASAGRSNSSSGCCARYWSSGSSCATSTASDSSLAPARPARPAATSMRASPGSRSAPPRRASRCRSRARARSWRRPRPGRRRRAAARSRGGPRPGSPPGSAGSASRCLGVGDPAPGELGEQLRGPTATA